MTLEGASNPRRSPTVSRPQGGIFVTPQQESGAGHRSTVQATLPIEKKETFLERMGGEVEKFTSDHTKTVDEENHRLRSTNEMLIADLEDAVDMLKEQSATLDKEAQKFKKLSQAKAEQSKKVKEKSDKLCQKLGRAMTPIEIEE